MISTSLKDYSIPIQMELDALEHLPVTIEGKMMKPSQCYHFSTDPPRVLYNTNCPDELMQKIEAILEKYKAKSEEPPHDLVDILFELDGKNYRGWFSPSGKLDEKNQPVSYSIVLDGVFFGHLSLHNCNWVCSEQRPAGLIRAAGKQIELYYKL